MGWQPIPGNWFRWAGQQGVPVAESIWWGDGPIHQFNHHLHVEVGSGWLVLVTEQGFDTIQQRATHMSRGGVVRRRKGWLGNAGMFHARGVLAL
jgi:hypothetical protein